MEKLKDFTKTAILWTLFASVFVATLPFVTLALTLDGIEEWLKRHGADDHARTVLGFVSYALLAVVLYFVLDFFLNSNYNVNAIDYFFNKKRYLIDKTVALCTDAEKTLEEYRHCLKVAEKKENTFMENWDRKCMRLNEAAVEKESECRKSEIELDYEYKVNPPTDRNRPRDLLK